MDGILKTLGFDEESNVIHPSPCCAKSIDDICSNDIFYKIMDIVGYCPEIMEFMRRISPLEETYLLEF